MILIGGTAPTGLAGSRVIVINQLGGSPNLMMGGAQQQDKGPDFFHQCGQMKPVIQMQLGEGYKCGASLIRLVAPERYFWDRRRDSTGSKLRRTVFSSRTIIIKPNQRDQSFLLMAGNRADLLVKAPDKPCANPADCNVMVKNEVDPLDLPAQQALTLFSVRVAADPTIALTANQKNFIPNAPTFPLFLTDIADNEVTGTKQITFHSDASQGQVQHMINGKQFDGEVGAVVLLNQVEEWKIVNETYGGRIVSHPFHIHINPFQIVEVFSPNDTLPDPKKPNATIPKYIFDEGRPEVRGSMLPRSE